MISIDVIKENILVVESVERKVVAVVVVGYEIEENVDVVEVVVEPR